MRIQPDAAGSLALGGIDRGGEMGSDSETQGAAEEVSDGWDVGVREGGGCQGQMQGFWPEQPGEFGIYPRGSRKS